jgi:hypothetical protein
VPLAIEILHDNPLAEGDYYKGDLMYSLLSVDREFWKENRDVQKRMVEMFEYVRTRLEQEWNNDQKALNELIDLYNKRC